MHAAERHDDYGVGHAVFDNGQYKPAAQAVARTPCDGQLLGRLSEFDTNGTMDYAGLRLSLERRAPRDVSISANYTLSKCLQEFNADGQPNVEQAYPDPNNLAAERGNCDASRRHIFNLTTLYETPMFSNRPLRVIASEWRLAGIYRWASGSYLTVTSGVDRALTDITTQRPDQVLPDPYFGQVSTAVDAVPQSRGLRAAGDRRKRKRRARQYRRTTHVAARSRAVAADPHRSPELRSSREAYNLTNSFRPGNPVTALNSPQFGQIRSALDSRILQFALKYAF